MGYMRNALLILKAEGFGGFMRRLRWMIRNRLRRKDPDGSNLKVHREQAGLLENNEYGNRYDVIFFSITNWDFRYQRGQHLSMRFARKGHRVFYLNVFLKKGESYRKKKILENIYEITLPFHCNTLIYNADIDRGLETLILSLKVLFNDFKIKESIAFVQFPAWHPLVSYLKEKYNTKVIFDCLDHFSEFKGVNAEMKHMEEILTGASDYCIATSVDLFEKHKDKCKNIALVRNATEFEHFHHLTPNDLLKGIKKPIIGYYGAIAEWFDSGLIEYVASQRPDWSIVLIGHTFGSDIRKLKKFKNVYFLGEKPYGELPKFLYWIDVCMIPFKINELTLSTNPVKFYEFISSGKPVVAVRLPELLPYADILYLSKDKEDFIKNIETALKEKDKDLIGRRINLARSNDWDRRFDQICSCIKSVYPLASIITVTVNNIDYTKLCIESIFAKTAYPNYELIIVDNASSDGTCEWLQELREKHNNVKVVLNKENLGFAAAINIGIKESKGEYIIFLNNDTIVTRGWINGLTQHLMKTLGIGMVGPVTNSIGNEAKINVKYRDELSMELFAEKYTTKNKGIVFEIPVLALYCAAMCRDVMEKVGLLDEQFSVGMFEDDDYSLRIKRAGLKVVCAEDVFIHHFGGASFSRMGSQKYQRIFEENRNKFERKWGMSWKPHKYRNGIV